MDDLRYVRPWVRRHPTAALIVCVFALPLYLVKGSYLGGAEATGEWLKEISDLKQLRARLLGAEPGETNDVA